MRGQQETALAQRPASVSRPLQILAAVLLVVVAVAAVHQLRMTRDAILADTERQMARLDMVFTEQTGRAVESVDLLLGNARLRITGTVQSEPDAVSEGFGFAPRLLTSRDALIASGLITTGSLVEQSYRIRMDDPAAGIRHIGDRANAAFPQAGWSIRSSARAAPALADNVTRFSQFLTLVGLAALIVGEIGGFLVLLAGFLHAWWS